jgi:hypothetical protein
MILHGFVYELRGLNMDIVGGIRNDLSVEVTGIPNITCEYFVFY